MRHAMETRGGRFARWISPARQVSREQQRAYARDVRLEGQSHQIELQLNVFIESLGHADRHTHIGGSNRRSLHGDVQPALNLAYVVRVVVDARAIGRARFGAQTSEAAGQRVQNAAVPLPSFGALLYRAAVSEHPFEDHLRIQFHRQRVGRCGPGDGVGVRAAVAFAAVARIRARILDRQLHGRHQVFPADLLRDHLIDGGAGIDIGSGSLLGFVRAQERGGHPVVRSGRARRRFRRPRVQAAHDHRLIHERFQRLPIERKRRSQFAFGAGHPIAGRHPMGNEAADKSGLGCGRGLRQRC